MNKIINGLKSFILYIVTVVMLAKFCRHRETLIEPDFFPEHGCKCAKSKFMSHPILISTFTIWKS